jgi:endoglucanase
MDALQSLGSEKVISLSTVVLAACLSAACGSSQPGRVSEDPVRAGFLHRQGPFIVDAMGAHTRLRGVSFGNQVWSNVGIPQAHHDERDFERLRSMGMNLVRFYMNYRTFEDDARPFVYDEAGFAWLDGNVAWAKTHGVTLFLNLHVPQGGFQSNLEGNALWENPANQERVVALWRAIASRYADEPTIGGYDLLNEPAPVGSKGDWQALAQRITRAIREVDPNHLVIVERANAIAGKYDNDDDRNYILIDDENVAYTFHFYSPIDYTHQLTPWTSFGEGGKYPDPTKIAGMTEKWLDEATFDAASPAAGSSDFSYFEGPMLAPRSSEVVAGKPTLVGRNLRDGKVWFDDIEIREHDSSGAVTARIATIDLENANGWYFWRHAGGGSSGVDTGVRHSGAASLFITGTTDDANLGGYGYYFRPQKDRSYSVSGWMKAENLPPGGFAQVRLDYVGSTTPVSARDAAGLELELESLLAFGREHDVPLYLGEFGVYRACYANDKGGLEWVSDMLDLLNERGLPFTFHAYHEDAFGIYYGDGKLPDEANANQPLIELFTSKLGG